MGGGRHFAEVMTCAALPDSGANIWVPDPPQAGCSSLSLYIDAWMRETCKVGPEALARVVTRDSVFDTGLN